MKRLFASLVVLAILVLLLLVPTLGYSSTGDESASVYEPTTITHYVADFDVDSDGAMDVVETLTVNFPTSDRHGIFRFFDRIDAAQPKVRHIIEDPEVTMDGNDVPVERSLSDGRFDVLKIGDPDQTLSTGEHTYRISYHLPGVLSPGDQVDSQSQLYWNLIPSGWQQSIKRAELTVNLPKPAEQVKCTTGIGTSEQPCQVDGEGTDHLTIRAQNLPAHTPVTLLAGQAMPTPDQFTLPWSPRWDGVLGTHIPLLIGVLIAAVVLGLLGLLLGRLSVEKPPPLPLQYAPPEGIGPAQAAYILKERVDRDQYVASLMYAGERGALELEESGGGWTITDKQGPKGWEGLDPITRNVADILPGPNGSFVADRKSVAAGRRLKKEIEFFESSTKDWGRHNKLLVPVGAGGLGGPLVLVAGVVAVLSAFWNPFHMSMLGLPFAAFAAGGIGLLMPGASTKRTAAGRELWSRVGGFHRILSTPSAENRFDFSGRKELYTAYIPWAVAFGCADAWAEKYRMELREDPPIPAYFVGATYGTHGMVSSIVQDFDSTLGSAISSYQATQRSSSGGGGGFGGGGGGGGGGGSW